MAGRRARTGATDRPGVPRRDRGASAPGPIVPGHAGSRPVRRVAARSLRDGDGAPVIDPAHARRRTRGSDAGVRRRSQEGREDAGTSGLIPEPFHVPTIVLAIEVEVPHRTAPSLDPPVLAVATVSPPTAFDPPSPDHVHDLVALPAPLEDRGHPRVAFDANLLIEALRHGWILDLRPSRSLRSDPNRTYVRGWKGECTPRLRHPSRPRVRATLDPWGRTRTLRSAKSSPGANPMTWSRSGSSGTAGSGTRGPRWWCATSPTCRCSTCRRTRIASNRSTPPVGRSDSPPIGGRSRTCGVDRTACCRSRSPIRRTR